MSFNNQSTRPVLEDAYDGNTLTVEARILTGMLSAFALVGSIGNTLVLMVFHGLKNKATSRLFIMALAVIDLFTCVVIIPLTLIFELTHHQLHYDIFCKVYHFLITSQIPFSALIMVAIACDRYLCICHSIMVILTPVCTKITLVCLTILTVVLGIIPTLGFGVYEVVPETDDDILNELPVDLDFWQLESLSEIIIEEQGFNGTLPSEILCVYFTKNVTNCEPYSYVNYFENMSNIFYDITCRPTEIWMPFRTLYIYQIIHSLLFAACFVIVLVLYGMIYRFMSKRRSDKLKHKLSVCARIRGDSIKLTMIQIDKENKENEDAHPSENKYTTANTSTTFISSNKPNSTYSPNSSIKSDLLNNSFKKSSSTNSSVKSNCPNTSTTILSRNSSTKSNSTDTSKKMNTGNPSNLSNACSQSCAYGSNDNHPSRKRVPTKKTSASKLIAQTRSANIKTAIMLGVVTVVFFVAFFPAWLMALGIVPIQIVIFYLYFIHNIANPFVYAFMNPAFRERLSVMFMSWVNRITRMILHLGNVEPSKL